MKYGTSNPRPRIDIACSIHDTQLQFSVTDNGKGIASEDQVKVFELFRCLDPKESDGSGVGLVAVRRQVVKVGGDIQLKSSKGRGAKFIITIPIAKSSDRKSAGQRQVLLIEDDPLDKRIVQRCFNDIASKHGVQVDLTWVSTLNAAKDVLLTKYIDLIVLDLSLPDGHGLNFLTEFPVVHDPPFPVIILSGHGEGIPFSKLKEHHVTYLSKIDLNAETLLAAMEAIMSHSPKLVS